MNNNPVTKRELQEALDLFQSAMTDELAIQHAKIETLGLRISDVDGRLKSLQSGVEEIQNFVKERANLEDERYSKTLDLLSGMNKDASLLLKIIRSLQEMIKDLQNKQ